MKILYLVLPLLFGPGLARNLPFPTHSQTTDFVSSLSERYGQTSSPTDITVYLSQQSTNDYGSWRSSEDQATPDLQGLNLNTSELANLTSVEERLNGFVARIQRMEARARDHYFRSL